MRRTEHLGARALTVVGLVATCAYLVWRVGFSMHDTELWLSLPAFAVELLGFLGACTLAWALWPVPVQRHVASRRPTDPSQELDAADAGAEHVDAVVRVDEQPVHEVRATLLALRSVRRVRHVVVVDLRARPEMAALATEFQAVYAASDPSDRNGVRVMMAAAGSPQFLLIEAGDIPTGDIVELLSTELDDPRVAIVQGMGVSLADDSAEHGPNGRHELIFERASLNPSLGRRGSAVWLGTGSLVRVDALRGITVENDCALEAQWLIGTSLLAAGWKIAAPGDVPVVSQRAVHSESAVGQDRLQRARAARRMIVGQHGVLRSRSFSFGQRLAMLAWAVRPLSGLRRLVFMLLLGSAILAGTAPFHATTGVLLLGWLPAFLYTSLGLALLSGWTLRPGDRTRWSLHSMGAAVRSLRTAGNARPAGRAPIIAVPSPQYGVGLVISVVALSAILVLRGISDRVTHTLGAMPQSSLMVLLIVTIWTLAIALDLLRVLGRRAQMRRTARVVSSRPATLGERAVSIVDLTALGAGLTSQTGVYVNERVMLDAVIPTRSGVTTMRVACIVRNVSELPTGDYRIGVEFGGTDGDTANALAEFCTIEPVWEQLGTVPSTITADNSQLVYVDLHEREQSSGRVSVRLVSLLALVGAVASSAPTTVGAAPSLEHRLSGVVVSAGVQPFVVPETTVIVSSVITLDTIATDRTATDTIAVDTSVVDTLELNLTTTPIDADEVAVGAPVPGAVVVAVCSLDAGLDGVWGTTDDVYGAPVAAVTGDDGSYELDLVGEACWASVAPPEAYQAPVGGAELQAVDVSGSVIVQPAVEVQPVSREAVNVAATGSIGDTVWSDNDRDGVQDRSEAGVEGVMLTLLDDQGRTVAHSTSDASGEFRFDGVAAGTYRVGAANLPAGLAFTAPMRGADPATDSDTDPITGHSARVVLSEGQSVRGVDVGLVARLAGVPASPAAVSAGTVDQVLPAPSDSQVATPGSSRSTLSIFVLALAALLAVSILLGLARPRWVQVR